MLQLTIATQGAFFGAVVTVATSNTVCDPSSGKLGIKGIPDFGIFWILDTLAKKNYNTCKFNNSKHLLTFALPKKCLKLDNESQNYHFCQQNSL
jgi:hypothetical protein